MLELIRDHLLCNVNNVQFVDHLAPKELNIFPLACTDVDNYRPISIICSIADFFFEKRIFYLLS